MSRKEQYINQIFEAIKYQINNYEDSWKIGWILPYETTSNGITGREYKGLNQLNLSSSPYDDNRWLTYNQVKELGGSIKAGEKGKVVEYFSFTTKAYKRDDKKELILDEKGQKSLIEIKSEVPIYKYYHLFNIEQTLNIDESKLKERASVQIDISKEEKLKRVERVDNLIEQYNIEINHGGKSAYYLPNKDSIQMPSKENFKSASEYYGTLLHELSHSTGHETRLNRDLKGRFATPSYAKEELIAEISSMLMSKEYGIHIKTDKEDNFNGNNIAYLKSWFKTGRLTDEDLKDSIKEAIKVQNFIRKVELTQSSFQDTKTLQELVQDEGVNTSKENLQAVKENGKNTLNQKQQEDKSNLVQTQER